jgi:hypothetical protein
MESQIMPIVALVLSVGTVIYSIINHKKIKILSTCCGRKIETSLSLDINNTTPLLKIAVPEVKQ